MNKPQYVIAVDIGTTSTKALLFDRSEAVVAEQSVPYPLYTPQPGIAEQDPEEIFAAVLQGIRALMDQSGIAKEQVRCVTFSSAMHSLILMDEANQPLTQSITWADQRSADSAELLNKQGLGLPVYLRTGTPIHPMSPLVKLVWMKEHEPELLARARKLIGIKEYVFFKLFGRYVVDYSIASATGMFRLDKLAWDEEALQLAGIQADQLSEAVSTTYVLTGLEPAYAEDMGLLAETPFVIGASDGVLANLGANVMTPARMAVTVGTSGAVRTVVDKPTFDPEGRLFCYALTEDHWAIGGASNNGAIVLQWAIEQWFADQGLSDPALFEKALDEAASVEPGAEGLLFLPLLTGERAPFWNPKAKGVMFGLTLAHKRKHMVRAALEGVMFQITSIVTLLEQMGGKPGEICASGGFARSPLWCQILADMTGVRIIIPEVVESSGLGAARLGLYAMGDLEQLVQPSDESKAVEYVPNPANHEVYRKLLPLYQEVYSQLVGSFDAITQYQQ